MLAVLLADLLLLHCVFSQSTSERLVSRHVYCSQLHNKLNQKAMKLSIVHLKPINVLILIIKIN